MAESPATTLTISEPASVPDRMVLVLSRRALPYRPLTLSGKQRVEFSWYPGSPIATSQVLGPEEEPFTMQGFWKEKFLGQEGVGRSASITNVGVASVRELVSAVDRMRRRGQLCRFTWDEIVRDGHITSFQQTWHNAYDCEWELEFSPISQGEQFTAPGTTPLPQLGDVAIGWQELGARTVERLDNPPLGFSETVAALVNEFDDLVLGATNAATNAVRGVVDNVMAGPDAINRLSAIGEGVILQSRRVFFSVCDQADETLFPVLGGAPVNNIANRLGVVEPITTDLSLPDDLLLSETINAAVYKSAVKEDVRGIRNFAVEQNAEYSTVITPNLLQTFLAQQNSDLRDISTEFYGTPDEWRTLMLFNRKTNSKVRAGELLFVPDLGNSGNGIGVPGAQP